MAPAHLGSDGVVTRGGANTAHLVGGDAHAETGPADEDSTIRAMIADREADGERVVGIVDAFAPFGTKIENIVTELLEERNEASFHLESAMVASNGNLHGFARLAFAVAVILSVWSG